MVVQRFSDHLRYVTVRILTSKGKDNKWSCSGTGFIYALHKDGSNIPVLVTNKTVLEDVNTVGMRFHITTNGQDPVPGPGRLITLQRKKLHILSHPDPNVNLAAIMLGPIMRNIREHQEWQIYTKWFNKNILPSRKMMVDFGVLQDVIMVGYPSGLVDEVNNFPIIRRGITSTPYASDYNGRRQFLADIPVYCGSAGAPIFIVTEACWSSAGSVEMGTHFSLIGMLHGGYIQGEKGKIVEEPIPTCLESASRIEHLMDLGLCIRSALIEELVEQL